MSQIPGAHHAQSDDLHLVRQQLQSELGYDSSAFSDEVLRAILADLTLTSEPLAFPSAATDPYVPLDPRSDRHRREHELEHDVAGEADEERFATGPPRQGRSSELMRHASRVPAREDDSPPPPPPSRHQPRPSTAPGSSAPARPLSARAPARAPHTEPRMPTSSRISFTDRSASAVGFIVKQSAVPARVKSDPVAMRQQRERQWGQSPFLKSMASPRHRHDAVLSTQPGLASLSSYRVQSDRLASRSAQKSPRSAAASSEYQVPTEKRRDSVVWDTRERLRREHVPHQTHFSKRAPVRNTYVPPTSLRRDELRWQVRSELAVVY